MELIINGEPRQVAPDCTAEDLVQLLELEGKRVAMEVNLEILPRSQYASHRFQTGDRVEIVQAIGGGSV